MVVIITSEQVIPGSNKCLRYIKCIHKNTIETREKSGKVSLVSRMSDSWDDSSSQAAATLMISTG